MWTNIARLILRNRILFLIILGLATVFMGYKARSVKLMYGLPDLLPKNDSTKIAFEQFTKLYGGEGSIYVISIEEDPLSDLKLFNEWFRLSKELQTIDGVDSVISVSNIFTLNKDTAFKRFRLVPVINSELHTKQELDSIRNVIYSLPFYKGLLYNDSTHATLMAVTMDSSIFNSNMRIPLVKKIMGKVAIFSKDNHVKVHYSGLPFVRTIITQMVKSEMVIFIAVAIFLTMLLLFLFFRSFKPVFISMLVVSIGVIWTLGSITLLGYKITILTGMLPSLIIVIGVPNCIFLINKYHYEFKIHGNQAKALIRVIQKVGNATFMTNVTTAIGFVTFIFTGSISLKEFGVVSALNIIGLFLISLIVIPIFFSYMPPPAYKHTKHLETHVIKAFVSKLIYLVVNRRKWIYLITAIVLSVGFYGIYRIQTTGNIVDNFAKDHFVNQDLHFFERHFKGIMPFEIAIDAHKPGLAMKYSNLKRIDKLEKLLGEYPVFSKPLSINSGIKFIKQSFYNGNPKKYSLIDNREKPFFQPYLKNENWNRAWLNNFIDTSKQHTRVRLQVADIGTKEMDTLLTSLKPRIDSIFHPDKYTVKLTGSSVVILAGTNYLVRSLFISLGIAIVAIALLMAFLFSSFRMIIISVTTNLIPLILTAALMGFFDIGLRPSTILVFSIAFGISVDDTIHFLVKYRQELRTHNWNIGTSVIAALKETGISMTYTSIVLFFGFTVFITSEFGGTKAMGILVSFTLLVAILANLLLLPSFLMWLDKAATTKAFKEPLLDIFDEEEDIEIEQLEIRKNPNGNSDEILTWDKQESNNNIT